MGCTQCGGVGESTLTATMCELACDIGRSQKVPMAIAIILKVRHNRIGCQMLTALSMRTHMATPIGGKDTMSVYGKPVLVANVPPFASLNPRFVPTPRLHNLNSPDDLYRTACLWRQA